MLAKCCVGFDNTIMMMMPLHQVIMMIISLCSVVFMGRNEATLKTVPLEKGIDVQSNLRSFYRRMYSAQYMTLAVCSKVNYQCQHSKIVLNHVIKGKVITSVLELLTPDKANITISSKNFKDECTEVEKWFQTNYRCTGENFIIIIIVIIVIIINIIIVIIIIVIIDHHYHPHHQCYYLVIVIISETITNIDSDWLKAWKNLQLNPELHLPAENSFIATDFDIKDKAGIPSLEFPEVILESELGKLWYRKDSKFNTPRGKYSHPLK
ncbi:hypothetical protein QZH41_006311 [Actinostola sp. cb2023]|nr:hypothetical protein QZH41_006311 [Actinostola sp. cb2023]